MNTELWRQAQTDHDSEEQWPEENLPQPAVVCTEDWAGRCEKPVAVIRATPKRYEVEYADGHRRLVPKYCVRFCPWSETDGKLFMREKQ